MSNAFTNISGYIMYFTNKTVSQEVPLEFDLQGCLHKAFKYMPGPHEVCSIVSHLKLITTIYKAGLSTV